MKALDLRPGDLSGLDRIDNDADLGNDKQIGSIADNSNVIQDSKSRVSIGTQTGPKCNAFKENEFMELINDDVFKRAVGGNENELEVTMESKQKRKRRNRWYNKAYNNIRKLQDAYMSKEMHPGSESKSVVQPAIEVALGYQNLMCFSITNPSNLLKSDFHCCLDTGASHSVISVESVKFNPVLAELPKVKCEGMDFIIADGSKIHCSEFIDVPLVGPPSEYDPVKFFICKGLQGPPLLGEAALRNLKANIDMEKKKVTFKFSKFKCFSIRNVLLKPASIAYVTVTCPKIISAMRLSNVILEPIGITKALSFAVINVAVGNYKTVKVPLFNTTNRCINIQKGTTIAYMSNDNFKTQYVCDKHAKSPLVKSIQALNGCSNDSDFEIHDDGPFTNSRESEVSDKHAEDNEVDGYQNYPNLVQDDVFRALIRRKYPFNTDMLHLKLKSLQQSLVKATPDEIHIIRNLNDREKEMYFIAREIFPWLNFDDWRLRMNPYEVFRRQVDVTNSILSVEEKLKLFEILYSNINAFACFDQVGCALPQFDVDFNFKSRPPPTLKKPYAISPHMQGIFQDLVTKLIKLGIITPTRHVLFSSPTMAVIKPGQDKNDPKLTSTSYRLVMDLRALNHHILENKVATNSLYEVQKLIGSIPGKCRMACWDISSAFYAIRIKSHLRKFCGLSLPVLTGLDHSSYQLDRLPMGLKISSTALANVMSSVLAPLQRNYQVAVNYADDVYTLSDSCENFFNLTNRFLKRIQEVGFTLSPKKAQILPKEITILGFKFSQVEDGTLVSIVNSRSKAILDWPPPRNIKGLRKFLGALTYIVRHVPKLSIVGSPLYKLTGKKRFVWTELEQTAFDKVKELVAGSPNLYCPVYSKSQPAKFYLFCDASITGCAGLLYQLRNNENGEAKLYLIAFASEAFPPNMRHSSSLNLEAKGALTLLRKFQYAIVHQHVTVVSDNSSLVFLSRGTGPCPNKSLATIMHKINTYGASIVYLRGDLHPADSLSRIDFHSELEQCREPLCFDTSEIIDGDLLTERDFDNPALLAVTRSSGRAQHSSENKQLHDQGDLPTTATPVSNKNTSTQIAMSQNVMHGEVDLPTNTKTGSDKNTNGQIIMSEDAEVAVSNKKASTSTSSSENMFEKITPKYNLRVNPKKKQLPADFLHTEDALLEEKSVTGNQLEKNKAPHVPTPSSVTNTHQSETIINDSVQQTDAVPEFLVNLDCFEDNERLVLVNKPVEQDEENVLSSANKLLPDVFLEHKTVIQDIDELKVVFKPSKGFIQGQNSAIIETIVAMCKDIVEFPFDKKCLVEAQANDKTYGPLYNYLRYNLLPTNKKVTGHCLMMADRFVLVDNLLLKLDNSTDQLKLKLFVPTQLSLTLIDRFHLLYAHIAIKKLFEQISDKYFVPNLYQLVYKYVQCCHICQRNKRLPENFNYQYLFNIGFIARPWDKVGADIMSLPSSFGYSSALVVVDYFSRYLILEPLQNITAKTVTDVFVRKICPEYGVPVNLFLDQGSCFTSNLFKQVMQFYKCKLNFYQAHCHSANIAERFCGLTRSRLLATVETFSACWPSCIKLVQYAINASKSPVLKRSPFEVMFNREPSQILPDDFLLLESPAASIDEYLKQLDEQVHKVRSTVKELLVQSQLNQQERHTRELKNINNFSAGQLVYVTHVNANDVTNTNRKFTMGLAGPFVIKERVGVRSFSIISLQASVVATDVHVNRIFPCKLLLRDIKCENIKELKTAFASLAAYSDLRYPVVLENLQKIYDLVFHASTVGGIKIVQLCDKQSSQGGHLLTFCNYDIPSQTIATIKKARWKNAKLYILLETEKGPTWVRASESPGTAKIAHLILSGKLNVRVTGSFYRHIKHQMAEDKNHYQWVNNYST